MPLSGQAQNFNKQEKALPTLKDYILARHPDNNPGDGLVPAIKTLANTERPNVLMAEKMLIKPCLLRLNAQA